MKEISVWTTGGMIVIEENPGIRTEACPNNGLPTINPTQTGMGLNSSLSGQRPAASHLSHGAIDESTCGIKRLTNEGLLREEPLLNKPLSSAILAARGH